MYMPGQKVRLTRTGLARVQNLWIGKPKRLAFYAGTLTVRYGFDGLTYLHYPVGLDVEDSFLIFDDRAFCISNDSLEPANA